MKAIVLAAGRGSRMNESTAKLPKCMMRLCGKSLLDRCMNSLLTAGFARSDIGIVTGYRSEKIQIPGVRYFQNTEWETTNMFISLTKAREWLLSEPCLVSYSDIVYSSSTACKLMEDDSEIAITYYTKYWELWSKRMENPLDDLETFLLEGGKLAGIGKKPTCREDIQGQYMGLLRFTPSGWRKIDEAIRLPMPKPLEKLDMTTLLQHLLDHGHEVTAIPTDDLWLECDSQEDIQVYEREFSQFL